MWRPVTALAPVSVWCIVPTFGYSPHGNLFSTPDIISCSEGNKRFLPSLFYWKMLAMHANPNSQLIEGPGSHWRCQGLRLWVLSSTPRNPKTHWRTQRKHAKQPMWEKEKVCSNPIPAWPTWFNANRMKDFLKKALNLFPGRNTILLRFA